MIYVTIGTTQFEDLIKEVDKLALDITDKIVIQIGNGKYIPKNCQYFRYTNYQIKYYKKANIIISHGGAGTIFEVLNLKKKLIALDNELVPDTHHQWDLLKKLSDEKYIIWCKDISKISDSIKKAEKFKFKKYVQPECSIHKKIIGFLG